MAAAVSRACSPSIVSNALRDLEPALAAVVPATRPAPVVNPAEWADAPWYGPRRGARLLAWLATAAIIVSMAVLVAASAARAWPIEGLGRPAGPPWLLGVHVAPAVVTVALWAAAVLGGGGVLAGLLAVRRGARMPVRLLLAVVLAGVAALVVLPPLGSTDSFDYAAYGRIAVLGHSPYLMTPQQLAAAGDPVGRAAAPFWGTQVSVYGPLATAEQRAAAALGGTSILRIVFWLKLANALAFCAVALAADRLLRSDPARRARAHLLWTLNPLLIWALIAGVHVDAIAAALGFLGLVVASAPAAARAPCWARALAAGVLVGAAADVKLNFALFAVALLWACRRSVTAAAAAVTGVAAVLVPSYLQVGYPAVRAVFARTGYLTADSYYRLLFGPGQQTAVDRWLPVAGGVVLVVLLLGRPPAGSPRHPALAVALLLSAAWLFVWPYQMPWYDTMAICLLLLSPASRLDWLVLARLTAGTLALMTGTPGQPLMPALITAARWINQFVAPAVLLAALLGLAWLGATGRWNARRPGRLSPAQAL